MPSVSQSSGVTLKVLIVGAGIGGLTVAIALKRCGHQVTLIERSAFLNEVGAAVTLTPNGTRVLKTLGFDFERAAGVEIRGIVWKSATSLEVKNHITIENVKQDYNAPWEAYHRADLHSTLAHHATEEDGQGPPARIILSANIQRINVDNAEVELDNGSVFKGDLLVGADGLRSVVRVAATGDSSPPKDTGWTIFRFLVPTEEMEADPTTKAMIWNHVRTTHILPTSGDRLVWYQCRNGELQNLAAFHFTKEGEEHTKSEDYLNAASKDKLLDTFRDSVHADVLAAMSKADEIKEWRLYSRHPLESYVYGNGKTVLVGDAAHPMLPFMAQGANQAIEDAGSLFVVLNHLSSKEEVPARLNVYEKIRLNRANLIQVLSDSPVETQTKEQVELAIKYGFNPGKAKFDSAAVKADYGYDVMEASRKALEAA